MKERTYLVIIAVFCIALAAMTYLAYWLSIPRCDDLIKYQFNSELICERSLGFTTEDSVKVRMTNGY